MTKKSAKKKIFFDFFFKPIFNLIRALPQCKFKIIYCSFLWNFLQKWHFSSNFARKIGGGGLQKLSFRCVVVSCRRAFFLSIFSFPAQFLELNGLGIIWLILDYNLHPKVCPIINWGKIQKNLIFLKTIWVFVLWLRYVKEMHIGLLPPCGCIWNLLLDEFLKYEKGGPNEDKSMLQNDPLRMKKMFFSNLKKMSIKEILWTKTQQRCTLDTFFSSETSFEGHLGLSLEKKNFARKRP